MDPDLLDETPDAELLGSSLGRLGPVVLLGVPGVSCLVDPLSFSTIYSFLG